MKLQHLFETSLIYTPEFKNWFGDSKVIKVRTPLVVYHGTPDDRELRATGEFKSHSWKSSVSHFFTDSRRVAKTYADWRRAFDHQGAEPSVLACYLKLENPLIVDAEFKRWRETEKHITTAMIGGHDGIIIKNSYDEYHAGLDDNNGIVSTVYSVFDSCNIKSVNNDGSFDIDDPDIFS